MRFQEVPYAESSSELESIQEKIEKFASPVVGIVNLGDEDDPISILFCSDYDVPTFYNDDIMEGIEEEFEEEGESEVHIYITDLMNSYGFSIKDTESVYDIEPSYLLMSILSIIAPVRNKIDDAWSNIPKDLYGTLIKVTIYGNTDIYIISEEDKDIIPLNMDEKDFDNLKK